MRIKIELYNKKICGMLITIDIQQLVYVEIVSSS